MTCEDTRGEWGGVCPGCGQRLPRKVSRTAYLAERARVRNSRVHLWREVTEQERRDWESHNRSGR